MTGEGIRLSKRVMELRECSRREAELLIEGGWVRVDGVVVEEPQFRVAAQQVVVDPAGSVMAVAPATLLLHKPAGLSEVQALRLLAPASRSPDDASGIRTVKKHFIQLEPLLFLPEPASGLMVFSQDPRIVRKLTEDARVIEQELIAEVQGEIRPNGLALLCHGLAFNGKPLPPVKVSWQNEHRLRFALKGIAPGQVPSMCEQVGLRVTALKRIRIGRVPMAQIAPGQWRFLHDGERF